MAATPYKPTTWGDEPVFTDKLNQMANNEQWLYENTPRMMFSAWGIKRTSGVKVLAGIAICQGNQALWSPTSVNFGTFFSSGCKPVVVTGTQPTSSKWRYHTIIKGIGTYYPDHRGIEIHVGADYYGTSTRNTVDSRVYVHYVVIGW